jgi:hypothetical protein
MFHEKSFVEKRQRSYEKPCREKMTKGRSDTKAQLSPDGGRGKIRSGKRSGKRASMSAENNLIVEAARSRLQLREQAGPTA